MSDGIWYMCMNLGERRRVRREEERVLGASSRAGARVEGVVPYNVGPGRSERATRNAARKKVWLSE